MKRILIIEVNWVGDVLFTTPAIRAVREHNTDAFIACLILPRCAEMLEGNPHIDEIIVYDENEKHKGVIGKVSLILELRKRKFDTAISFHRSMSRLFLAASAGIRQRIGYYTKKRFWLLTDAVELPHTQTHRVEYFLNIVRSIGMDTDNKDYEFFIPHSSFTGAEKILKEAGIKGKDEFFVINPGGNWPPKRWPKDRYAALCKALKSFYGKNILITGAQKDIALADNIIKMSDNSAVSICGKTTLKELGAIMKKAMLVITNDSGPMHIAVSQKTPVIALFGPTSPKITGPYGNAPYIVLHKWFDCQIPCYAICEDYRCMEAISTEDVLEASAKLLSNLGKK